jgi:hypothetical protein
MGTINLISPSAVISSFDGINGSFVRNDLGKSSILPTGTVTVQCDAKNFQKEKYRHWRTERVARCGKHQNSPCVPILIIEVRWLLPTIIRQLAILNQLCSHPLLTIPCLRSVPYLRHSMLAARGFDTVEILSEEWGLVKHIQ